MTKEERCSADVPDRGTMWPGFHRCDRRGIIKKDNVLYCRQHDPSAVVKRDKEKKERHDAIWEKRRMEIHGASFLEALRTIANGHNDPRSLAQGIIKEFER